MVFCRRILGLVALTSTLVHAQGTPTTQVEKRDTTTTGDSKCVTLMCISAVKSGDTVEYTLKSQGTNKMAWMAMGFGSTMANSPMVIMWPNSDGSITLSQRMAPAEVMPTVVSSPPRTASLLMSASDITGTNPTLSYTIPADSETTQPVIWAFGIVPPNNAAVNAPLQQHLDSGTFTLDLTLPIAANSTPSASTVSGNGSAGVPLQPYQKLIVAHAIVSVLGFLLFLPIGILVARYLRTITPTWFTGHWISQVVISGPIIIAGVALGIASVSKAGSGHLNDNHKKWGVAIFVLYFAQITFGTLIHFVKPASAKTSGKRPFQNYSHAILGLLIIAFAFYQVRTGYKTEWPKETGRGALPNGVMIVWIVWIVLLPVLYFAGLALLPKQFKKERAGKTMADTSSE